MSIAVQNQIKALDSKIEDLEAIIAGLPQAISDDIKNALAVDPLRFDRRKVDVENWPMPRCLRAILGPGSRLAT